MGLVWSKMSFKHPRGDVVKSVVGKSLDFRERSRLELQNESSQEYRWHLKCRVE